ncbi:MAG: hypothetical protein ACTHYM_12270 [Actinomycetaceae bacterium]
MNPAEHPVDDDRAGASSDVEGRTAVGDGSDVGASTAVGADETDSPRGKDVARGRGRDLARGHEDDDVVTPGQLMGMVDSAIRVEGRRSRSRVRRLRQRMWRSSPERLVARLEREYVRSAARLGGAVGATAALPVLGTAVAVGLTSAQVAAFVDASARHVLAVAEVHGIKLEDAERRRTLLLAALLGKEGARAVSGGVGVGTLAWARTTLSHLSSGSVRSINKALAKRLAGQGARRGVGAVAGRLAPFGIGMVLGYRGMRAMARDVVEGTRTAFGPPPEAFED